MTWSPRALLQMIRADFLERVRRYSFLVTMMAGIYLGYAVIAGYIVIYLGDYRGVYNSAWVGTLVAASSAVFISLVGFYMVKNAVSRDRQTGVGQILAATPVGKFFYLLGKTISNFFVLAAIVVIQVIAAILMQLLSKESSGVDVVAIVLPIALITLPALAFVAAVAVLFESIRWLRGGLGNVVYFFLMEALLILPLVGNVQEVDHLFIREIEASMHEGARTAYPEFDGGFSLQAGPTDMDSKRAGAKVFQWDGIRWTPAQVGRRLIWFAYAGLITLLAVPFFDRFDETRARRRKRGSPPAGEGVPSASPEMAGKSDRGRNPLGIFLANLHPASRFGRMLLAEVRLMVIGTHWAWHMVAVGLIVACLIAPASMVRESLLAAAWIWPVLLWSKMGMREVFHETGQLIFTAPGIRTRQLLAVWSAGVILALVTGMGAAVTISLSGEPGAIFGLLTGALFIPSFALVLGVWTGGSKFFEAVYAAWWYVGPMNRVPELDFTGMSSTPAIAVTYLLFSIACLALAVSGRRREVAV